MKSPTISTLPPPPKFRPPPPPSMPPPKPPSTKSQLNLSNTISTNQREQKQTLDRIQSNLNKLKSLSLSTLNPTPSTNHTINPSNIKSNSKSTTDLKDGELEFEEKKIESPTKYRSSSRSNIAESESDAMDIALPSIDIMNVYGVSQTNTNKLSWNDITNNYKYTQPEISGGVKLQFELSKLYGIKSEIDINKYFPPFECIRYFCGCSQEIDRAIKKWSYSIKMYDEYDMNEITENELIECFKLLSKSIAFGGLDADQCRIITIKYSLFFFSEFKNINIFLLAGFYLFYYLTFDIKAHRNGVCLLCDLNEFGLGNFSFTVEKTGIHFFQKVLPIRIKKVFVLDAPWIAHYALKMVLPLLNEKLKKRVFIVTRDELYGQTQTQQNNENDDGNKEQKQLIDRYELPSLVGGYWDKKYLKENDDTFLFKILSEYYKKSIHLKHFDVDFQAIV